ncbi:MAG: tRNA (adenosine(37)-N6)-dimethylallyltransferase MiaA, partial [Thermoflexales bacterium]|nr:tRNA (adenosine(37)-N6)-dimethylallyltransferase MiaA [Thermoflexales bacterium]
MTSWAYARYSELAHHNGRHLIVIAGPTAVGKTAYAVDLARRCDGEIVSADSRQIYRAMDIGTAKPSPDEQAAVRHHLIDVVDPDGSFTLAQYQAAALDALDDIWARGMQPLLVGGTGLYIKAVIEGWHIPPVPPDPELRHKLQAQDGGALYERLRELDPAAAENIDPRNVRRTIRALEVCLSSGQRFSDLGQAQSPPYPVEITLLDMARGQLYARIDARVDAMIERGLVAEVESLVARGYGWNLASMSGLGYKQIGAYLRGECSLDEAIA